MQTFTNYDSIKLEINNRKVTARKTNTQRFANQESQVHIIYESKNKMQVEI